MSDASAAGAGDGVVCDCLAGTIGDLRTLVERDFADAGAHASPGRLLATIAKLLCSCAGLAG
jgi:hypothetical protein